MTKFTLLFALASMTAAPPALAADPAPLQGLPPEASNPAVQAAWAACNDDIAKFCPGVVPGGGRIVRCLIANGAQISPACRAGMWNAKTALGR